MTNPNSSQVTATLEAVDVDDALPNALTAGPNPGLTGGFHVSNGIGELTSEPESYWRLPVDQATIVGGSVSQPSTGTYIYFHPRVSDYNNPNAHTTYPLYRGICRYTSYFGYDYITILADSLERLDNDNGARTQGPIEVTHDGLTDFSVLSGMIYKWGDNVSTDGSPSYWANGFTTEGSLKTFVYDPVTGEPDMGNFLKFYLKGEVQWLVDISHNIVYGFNFSLHPTMDSVRYSDVHEDPIKKIGIYPSEGTAVGYFEFWGHASENVDYPSTTSLTEDDDNYQGWVKLCSGVSYSTNYDSPDFFYCGFNEDTYKSLCFRFPNRPDGNVIKLAKVTIHSSQSNSSTISVKWTQTFNIEDDTSMDIVTPYTDVVDGGVNQVDVNTTYDSSFLRLKIEIGDGEDVETILGPQVSIEETYT